MNEGKKSAFEEQAGDKRSSLVGEFWEFLSENKKWWLLPIIIVFLVFGLVLVLGSTPLGQFVYTLI